MQIVFRTDASVQIGTGHVMRCLTLADALHLEGAECIFICRDHPGHLRDLIQQRGHHVQLLTAGEPLEIHNDKESLSHAAWLGTDWTRDASDTQAAITPYAVDWLVVDHYALDHRWEKALRPFCQHVMVIDDLADRTHDCDLLLDQNLGRSAENYRDLVPKHATTLMGPQYALLRPEFSSLREKSLARRRHPKLQHLLITFGGVDKDNLTGEVLETLRWCQLPADLQITVVMGAHAPWLEQVHAIANSMPLRTQVVINTNHMARLMADSDLCIGAAGGTAWERCALGLPTLLFQTAKNQENGANALKESGAVVLIEKLKDIQGFFSNQGILKKLTEMTGFAANISNGTGTTRIVSQLLAQKLTARAATKQDCALLFKWANDTLTRKNSFNTQTIIFSNHQKWFFQRLSKSDTCRIVIIQIDNIPVGQVRLEKNEFNEWEIDYSLAPDFRGKSLGYPLLKLGLLKLSDELKSGVLIGKVRRDNLASCRVFEKLGFEIRATSIDVVCYAKSIESGLI